MEVTPFDPGFSLFFGLSFALSIAFTVLLIVLIVLGIRWLWRANARMDRRGPTPPGQGPDDAALTALRERFARGEIDEDEYQRRRRILET